MPTLTAPSEISQVVAQAAVRGLTASPKTLPPWLFYDQAGSRLFEEITSLPEYYLTRTERALFAAHADDIFNALPENITIAELGAGTATKTGLLLSALARRQPEVLYQPIDISPSALEEAAALEATIPGVRVRPQAANYITERVHIARPARSTVLALYIGSSVGNFSPAEARAILGNLRSQLLPGDALLLGTDMAPSPAKPVATLIAAYDDAAGVTAAFNLNILHRLNRDIGSDFEPDRFAHSAVWNSSESRIEMHLRSLAPQSVHLPVNEARQNLAIEFASGESIHTENSYKFTAAAISSLLVASGFVRSCTFTDPHDLYTVTLAQAV